MARVDDTNTTRFFVTEIDAAADANSERNSRLNDFNNSVFGILIEGEDVRERISNVATNGSDAPQTPVVVQSVEIITDTENDVLMLKAADGGMQYTSNGNQPIWSTFAGLASPRGEAIRWNLGVLATNTASLFTSQSGAYTYLSLAGQVNVPF